MASGPDAPTASNWLFKQGDLLLGPVPFQRLVEMLYAGDLDADTLAQQHGGEGGFRKLSEIDAFKVHCAKAQAKQRVEKQSVEIEQKDRKSRVLKLLGVGVVGLAVLLGGGRLAWWLAIHRPWEKQIQLPEATITEELPTIKLASARKDDDELSYPDPVTGKPPLVAQNTPPVGTPPKGIGKPPPRTVLAQKDPKQPKGIVAQRPVVDNDVNSLQQWDQGAINGVVKANKKTLHGCLSAEAQRQKGGWSARIPIEFTIGNDGHVSKLWIDNPDFKGDGSELFKCMYGELRKWQFPRYDGEQANVSLAFNVGAK